MMLTMKHLELYIRWINTIEMLRAKRLNFDRSCRLLCFIGGRSGVVFTETETNNNLNLFINNSNIGHSRGICTCVPIFD